MSWWGCVAYLFFYEHLEACKCCNMIGLCQSEDDSGQINEGG